MLEKILKTEFSNKFVEGMKNRMIMSYYKYGKVSDAYPHKINALRSLDQRILKYKETGNLEYLIDAANFAMIEFMYPSQNNAHFIATDDKGSPGRILKLGKITKQNNQDI